MNRIAMIVMSLYPEDPRVRREAECLEKRGIYSDIICMKGTDESRTETIGNIHIYRIIRTRNKENILKYLMLTLHFMTVSFFVLAYLSIKKRYRLIQFHNMPDFLVFTAFMQKFSGTPVILDFHDLSVELFQSKWGEKRKALVFLVKIMEKLSAGFADRLITTSSGFRDRLISRGIRADKITLVLNSADQSIFHYNQHRSFRPIEKKLKLLYHGTVTKRFGLDIAVKAVSILKAFYPDIILEIFGKYDDSYYRELTDTVKTLKLGRYVKLGGYLSLENIYKKINESDIGIVPYRKDPFMELALSTKTFEYVASGLPVVSPKLASIELIFPDDCMEYFMPGDATDLARAVLALCESPELRALHVSKAYEHYRNYSWDSMGRKYADLISSTMIHQQEEFSPSLQGQHSAPSDAAPYN